MIKCVLPPTSDIIRKSNFQKILANQEFEMNIEAWVARQK